MNELFGLLATAIGGFIFLGIGLWIVRKIPPKHTEDNSHSHPKAA